MTITVRDLRLADEPRWRELWAGYLDFYEYPDLDPKITANTWAMLSGERADVFGMVAEADAGAVIGFVHGVVHANTWIDKPICYLEDLFVDPSVRGQGAGRALIEALIAHAKANDWGQVYWRTAETNPARKLYDQVADKIDFVTYVHALSPKTV
ncbi:GNAT family N-acetyltransferase [Magnetovibrio sp.]|uniref:GNAT family N-acetyltransferase n=1 Tax=Magnetovibrio sp. TaxID=2024836 RepID=UPI002F932657